jgi:hypothetical protein
MTKDDAMKRKGDPRSTSRAWERAAKRNTRKARRQQDKRAAREE